MPFLGSFLLLFLLSGCGPVAEIWGAKASEEALAQGQRALWRADDYRAANEAFEEAVRLRPSADVYARVGLSYFFKYDFVEALSWLEKALEVDPQQPWTVKVALAAGYARTGEDERAQETIDAALTTMPEDPMVLNNAAYTVADTGLLLDEMIVILERAVELTPKNGDILDSLGWAYYQKGDTVRAEAILEEATRYSDNSIIKQHLAEVRLANR